MLFSLQFCATAPVGGFHVCDFRESGTFHYSFGSDSFGSTFPSRGMGLGPLAAVLFFKILKGDIKSIIREASKQSLLPTLMLPLLAVYFLRAEGSVRVAPLWMAWGWWECLIFFLRMTVAWSLLVLPLWSNFKSDPVFRVTAVYLLLGYLLFIGSFPNNVFSDTMSSGTNLRLPIFYFSSYTGAGSGAG